MKPVMIDRGLRDERPGYEEGDAPDEEHDGLIEVEVERGESRHAEPGTLKRQSKTVDHLMTHTHTLVTQV